jgi:hypothetical protein
MAKDVLRPRAAGKIKSEAARNTRCAKRRPAHRALESRVTTGATVLCPSRSVQERARRVRQLGRGDAERPAALRDQRIGRGAVQAHA